MVQDNNVADAVARMADRLRDQTALVQDSQQLSYREVDLWSRRVATHLHDCGIREGDTLGIALMDGIDFVLCLLGAARLGAAVLPIDFLARQDERKRLADAYRLSAMLVEPTASEDAVVRTLAIDQGWREAAARASPWETGCDGSTPFLVSMSSGTTMAARGTVVSHDVYLHRVDHWLHPFGGFQGHRYLSVSRMCFAAGLNAVLRCLVDGGTVVFCPFFCKAGDIVNRVERDRIDCMYIVPAMARQLLQIAPADRHLFPGLHRLVVGADVLSADEKMALSERICPNFYQSYGTAGSDTISCLRPEDLPDKAESVGRVLSGFEAEIVDDQDRPLAAGEIGQLRLRGSAVMEEAGGESAERGSYRHGYFYPGDIASFDGDGYLFLHGRSSNTISRGAITVFADEVEAVLREHPSVVDCAVVGAPSEPDENSILAFVETEDAAPISDLRVHCVRRLTGYKVPDRIIAVTELPRTASGKIKRGELGRQWKAWIQCGTEIAT